MTSITILLRRIDVKESLQYYVGRICALDTALKVLKRDSMQKLSALDLFHSFSRKIFPTKNTSSI